MPNRLADESSPYLLQHKDNPVDWYPWGDEALNRSVEENKPILLSIGYSACHWCHVMEHESFEDAEIARLMNENFVCIKVDREERPDLDQIYQNVAQALTRGGGWPLTVFLTPARRPFFGGTYFPPEDRHGRAGFKRVLQSLAKAYQSDPISVAQNAMKLTAYIDAAENAGAAEQAPPSTDDGAGKPEWLTLENAADVLLSHMDPSNGGIGDAPKFPNVMALAFLWRIGSLRDNEAAMQAVLLTLRKMASGGIYDQIGGGFSRYSVDATWSVPHFEKMLYDNGLLLKLYSEVLLTAQSEGVLHAPVLSKEDRELFLRVLRASVGYLLREMEAPDGGFYAAQDADSDGEEGKFFVWDPQELEEALPDERARKIFALRFGVNDAGNFEGAKTVLFLARSPEQIASELGSGIEEIQASLKDSVSRVFETRRRRIPPATDTKILASWNGLAISGLAWASQVFRAHGLVEDAEKALRGATRSFELVAGKMASDANGKLAATFQGGRPRHNAYLDDYAFMAQAALDLSRASENEATVSKALRMGVLWTKRVIRHFRDEKRGGYFFTSDDHEELLHRPKSVFDQAIPSGIAVSLQCLLAFAEIDAKEASEFAREGEEQLRRLFPSASLSPFGCAELLNAAILYAVGPVTVSGTGASVACVSPYVFRKAPEEDSRAKEGFLLVCHRRACDAPYSSAEELKNAALKKLAN